MSENYGEPGPLDVEWIKQVESNHFRTNEDTGANLNALLIWNIVRSRAGLSYLRKDDLPAHCETHGEYHVIDEKAGCIRTRKS